MPTDSPIRARPGVLALIGYLLAALGVGALGGWVTSTSVETWYPALRKPPFNPPGAVFGPVWTALYILMAVAAWRVWRAGLDRPARGPISLWGLQLALNLAWSCLFFGLRNPAAALLEVLLLWAAIAATLVAFWRRDRAAGLMLAPYLAWASFAAVLNFEIWRLN